MKTENQKVAVYEDLVALTAKSHELNTAAKALICTALETDDHFQNLLRAFREEVRAFLEKEAKAEEEGEGILVKDWESDLDEKTLASRLSQEFSERAELSSLLLEDLVEEGQEVWEDRWEETGVEGDWGDEIDGLSLDVEVSGELARLFQQVAVCGT